MRRLLISIAALTASSVAAAGPYSQPLNDPANLYDAPVPGFVGPDGNGMARLSNGDGTYLNPDNYVNPLFFGWASGWQNYLPSDTISGGFNNPALALGPVTGDAFDVVSMGDLSAAKLNAGGAVPGQITLTFSKPITNKPGADFVVFENGLVAQSNTGGAGTGFVYGELAYVEVSSDGAHFARFPSTSLTAAPVPSYGTIDATGVFGLAGKHANGYGVSWGTPFDLSALASDPLVTSGSVNLNAIKYVRIVDIPGRGDYLDSGGRPIYDPWFTSGSGGFDLEAVGVISQVTNYADWQAYFGVTASLTDYAGVGLPMVVRAGDRVGISFARDTRKVDLIYTVEASSDLMTWTTIARSAGGGNLVPVAPYTPGIIDKSDSAIASVGVIRREEVDDVVSFSAATRRFLRVRVTTTP